MTLSSAHLCMGCMRPMEAPVCPFCGWQDAPGGQADPYLPPRTVLHDRYIVGRVLGHGGFGITYLGWDTTLNFKIAIKEYFPAGLASRAPGEAAVSAYSGERGESYQAGVEGFLAEARELARFDDHPGIVGVRDFFGANGTAYMVMQCLEGSTLKSYLAAQPGHRLLFLVALRVLLPVLDALDSVHAAGLIHRDISPDNVYLTKQGQVKLLDFGAARQALADQSLSIILKHGYSPVEQYQTRGRQGAWTDVYAAAATLYRMLTGQAPSDAVERVTAENLQLPSALAAMPPAAEAVLLQAMSIRAEDRFQTVREFKAALLSAAGVTEAQVMATPLAPVAIEQPLLAPPTAGSLSQTASVLPPQAASGDASPTLKGDEGVQQSPALASGGRKRHIFLGLAAVLLVLFGAFFWVGRDAGVKTLPDGSLYTGEYAWNAPNGKGVLKKQDGTVLRGTFRDGQIQGEGVFEDPAKQLLYQGTFKDGLFDGQGSYTDNQTGTVYVGEFKAGQRSGQGKLTTKDRPGYEGEFRNDQLHGRGSMTLADGTVLRGFFREGLREGSFLRIPPVENMIYTGRYAKDKLLDREQPVAPFTVRQLLFRNEDASGALGEFATRFPQAQLRRLAFHMEAVNDLPRGFEGQMHVAYIDPEGRVMRDGEMALERATFTAPVQFSTAGEQKNFHQSWGDDETSRFGKGVYRVQFWWFDVKVAEDAFEVY